MSNNTLAIVAIIITVLITVLIWIAILGGFIP